MKKPILQASINTLLYSIVLSIIISLSRTLIYMHSAFPHSTIKTLESYNFILEIQRHPLQLILITIINWNQTPIFPFKID